MTVSSSFLIWLNRKVDASKAGFLYMMLLLLSSVLLLAGILIRQRMTGTFVFGPSEGELIFHYDYLILAAFGINAAVVPIHAWMTQGLPKATIPGAVFLSIFGIKTALYAMMRCFTGLDLLMVLGVVTSLYGGIYALFSNDIRRIMAYLMVAQTGLMITGIGMDSKAAFDGAIFLTYAHTFYNTLLFMAMGAVIFATGEDQLPRLGNLARKLPFLTTSSLLGMLALCAVPFFSGFPGISLIFEEALKLHDAIWGPLLAAFMSIAMVLMILAGGLRLPYFVFWCKSTGKPEPARKLPKNMVFAMGITGAFCLVQGIFPEHVNRLFSFPGAMVAMTPLKLAVGFLFPGGAFFLFIFLRPLLKPRRNELPDFERVYVWVAHLVMAVFSRPLSWLDNIWAEIYRTFFLRAYNFMARAFNLFDRKGIDGAVNRTASSVMFLSRISTRLQSRSLQEQLARMMLLALAAFVLIWLWYNSYG